MELMNILGFATPLPHCLTRSYATTFQLGEILWCDRYAFRDDANQPHLPAHRTEFNRIVGDQGFELVFALLLDSCRSVKSFTKSYFAVGFKLDHVRADCDISNYVPDFIVKADDGSIWIIDTKGREELELPQKMARLRHWCDDLHCLQAGTNYGSTSRRMNMKSAYRERLRSWKAPFESTLQGPRPSQTICCVSGATWRQRRHALSPESWQNSRSTAAHVRAPTGPEVTLHVNRLIARVNMLALIPVLGVIFHDNVNMIQSQR